MKLKYTFAFLTVFYLTVISQAQVRIANDVTNVPAPNGSAFIDASSNVVYNLTNTMGKGLLFPRTDLSKFTGFGGLVQGLPVSYPSRYDGMIVYNTKIGGKAGVGKTEGELTEGYWYYYNKNSYSTNGGTWKPLVFVVNVTSGSEAKTNVSIDGSQVYVTSGKFTATGSSTSVNIPAPSGIKSLYNIKIYESGSGNVYATQLYSYDISTGNAVTGSPGASSTYPADTYSYVLEYLK